MQYHGYAHKPAVEILGTATSRSLLCPPWYFSLLLVQEQLIPSCESLWICKHKEIVLLCACVFNPFEHASFFQISSSHFFLCVPPERKMRKKKQEKKACVRHVASCSPHVYDQTCALHAACNPSPAFSSAIMNCW